MITPTRGKINNFVLNSQLTEKNSIAKQHLDVMMADAGYLAFVDSYSLSPLGNSLMWWENEAWIQSDNHFELALTNSYIADLGLIDRLLSTWSTITDYRAQMHANELALFDAMSVIDKSTYLSNAGLASAYARILFPTTTANQVNDKADAYRHALFSLLNKQSFGMNVAETLGNAHEDWVGNPPLEKEMDLFNNVVGRNSNNSNSLIPRPLIIWNLVKNGMLKYINASGALVYTNQ